MSQRCVAFAVVLLFPNGAGAEEKLIPPPKTLPPQVCLATATEKAGTVEIRVSTPRMIPIESTRMVPRDGKPVPETFIWYKALMEATTLVVDGKEVKASRKDGKPVDPKELPKLLATRTHVLLVRDEEIDPYFLGVIDDKVLIITAPASKPAPPTKK
jgi:hypothetical protein